MKFRFTVVGIVQNDVGEYLICKKPEGEGVFPGQWGIPGGGIEEGERMGDALRREMKEEIGIEVTDINPEYFRDDVQLKYAAGKVKDEIYMVYLMFRCKAVGEIQVDNREYIDFAWVNSENILDYDLNEATRMTYEKIGVIKNREKIHADFTAYPTGAIDTGGFCDCCKRYNARYSVVDAVCIRDDKVLLAKRNHTPHRGDWSVLAGYVSWDETLEETVVREVREEAGLEVENISFAGVRSGINRDPDGKQNIGHTFIVQLKEGELVRQEDEIQELRFYELDNLPENMAFDHREILDQYIKSRESEK